MQRGRGAEGQRGRGAEGRRGLNLAHWTLLCSPAPLLPCTTTGFEHWWEIRVYPAPGIRPWIARKSYRRASATLLLERSPPAGRSPSRPYSGRITLLIVQLFYLSLVSLCWKSGRVIPFLSPNCSTCFYVDLHPTTKNQCFERLELLNLVIHVYKISQ
jgi:hypothetical protein